MDFENLINTFKIQPGLEKKLWGEDNKLHPKVRTAMLNAARYFYDNLDLESKPPIQDIVFTGSLANYNYSRLSDIDIHLLFNFNEFGAAKEVFEKFFILAKATWNANHDVYIRGYEVEIYAEDQFSQHFSTGVYSVQNNRWIKYPRREEPIVDFQDVKVKVNYFVNSYKFIIQNLKSSSYEESLDRLQYLRDKISKFRKGGLEKGGEFSVENITFKALRRIGFLDRLVKMKNFLTDKKLSLENSQNI